MNGIRALQSISFARIWVFVVLLLCVTASTLTAATPDRNNTPDSGYNSTQTPQDSAAASLLEAALTLLLKHGYSIEGPVQVSKVGPSSLTIFTGKAQNVEILLAEKRVTIKNSENKDMTLSEIKQFSKVYICRKGDEVVILVLPNKESRNA
ncbi:hypothetical protein [Desulfomonile tiedjei]|uniref:Uncharacterized protein n=1 Tax=Desulfomonile tiedjei (strain ATCC 49306 / DSM 6799 / DCB-1) TaxID=706587 RepID=I4CAB0_DESTA|nr:hypothetical protein [Desulfomonile tiedjei]AFM26501.1 hypothetical protein Desti_3859 [Desulfomonile tiedjei DSM 6799]